MNIKKNILSRMTRRKGSTPAEPEEEAYEIPPPSAIEPGVPYSAQDTKNSDYDSHIELELLASDDPPSADSPDRVDIEESASDAALELSAVPISDEPPSEPEPSRKLEVHQEYGLEMEVLAASESDELPAAPVPPQEHEEATIEVVESAVEATAPEPETSQESEMEATVDVDEEDEEVVSDVVESVVGVPLSEPEVLQESEPEAIPESIPEDKEPLAASISDESPSEVEPPPAPEPLEGYGANFEVLAAPESDESSGAVEPRLEDDEAVSAVAESVVQATPPEPEISQESEPEAAEVAADSPREEPDELSEPSITEYEIFPLVRDTRCNWRTGKGFSRSELREAGLSLAEVARLRVRVDKRRRNAHPMNVATLEKAKGGG